MQTPVQKAIIEFEEAIDIYSKVETRDNKRAIEILNGVVTKLKSLLPEEKEGIDVSKVTRVEIINHRKGGKGREYVNWNNDNIVSLQFQDNSKTLKIFIENTQPNKQ